MKLHSLADMQASMINALVSVEEARALVLCGSCLSVAGTESALDKLPAGNWIGGTTPYFLTKDGGKIVGDDEVFVTDLSSLGRVTITSFDADRLDRICIEGPENGFSLVIMPAQSDCHVRFALDAPFYPDSLLKPTVGWIAGFNVETGGQGRVYDGRITAKFANMAVVAQVAWDDESIARPEIINPFTVGDGDLVTFRRPGFVQTHCFVNGVEHRLDEYLREHELDDMRRPLVGDYGGAPINVALQSIDRETGLVRLYAPVFPDTNYRFAAPLDDYSAAFSRQLDAQADENVIWSCNCVLNFLLGALEGKAIPSVIGPATFGEIAYQLLTQTMVVLKKV